MEQISWSDFEKVGIYSGTIIDVIDFPEARKPAFIIHVDFGSEIGIKKTSAQVTKLYKKSDLVGKQILGVINFPVKQIGPVRSEFLLTGCQDEDGSIVVATLERQVPNGRKLH